MITNLAELFLHLHRHYNGTPHGLCLCICRMCDEDSEVQVVPEVGNEACRLIQAMRPKDARPGIFFWSRGEMGTARRREFALELYRHCLAQNANHLMEALGAPPIHPVPERSTQRLFEEVWKTGLNRRRNVYYPKLGTTCRYNQGECTDGTIGCIIGQAIIGLGWVNQYDPLILATREITDMPRQYYCPRDDGIFGVAELLIRLGMDVFCPELKMLENTQAKQDRGQVWGTAILV